MQCVLFTVQCVLYSVGLLMGRRQTGSNTGQHCLLCILLTLYTLHYTVVYTGHYTTRYMMNTLCTVLHCIHYRHYTVLSHLALYYTV